MRTGRGEKNTTKSQVAAAANYRYAPSRTTSFHITLGNPLAGRIFRVSYYYYYYYFGAGVRVYYYHIFITTRIGIIYCVRINTLTRRVDVNKLCAALKL